SSGLSISETSSEIKLTDLSKMESLLTPNNTQMTPLEKNGG
ncbi:TPA: helix-turn-helix domain-containing protein, partial [Legionella pneumophila]|nr:helix-turn-helix domain-containing protein [Legionella pneumophila]